MYNVECSLMSNCTLLRLISLLLPPLLCSMAALNPPLTVKPSASSIINSSIHFYWHLEPVFKTYPCLHSQNNIYDSAFHKYFIINKLLRCSFSFRSRKMCSTGTDCYVGSHVGLSWLKIGTGWNRLQRHGATVLLAHSVCGGVSASKCKMLHLFLYPLIMEQCSFNFIINLTF